MEYEQSLSDTSMQCAHCANNAAPRALDEDAVNIKDALRLIKSSKRIVVLTGAGISVSSGIPDFRSSNGVYKLGN
jgi:hypothetical protein